MKILGIDPGLGRAGWAVIDENKGRISAINYGCIETSSKSSEAERIKILYAQLIKIIEKYKPDILSVEKLFFNKNVKTALSVGQARGAIILAGVNKGLIVEEYTPLQVKIAVAGYGRADKNQVGQMVKSSFNLKSVPQPDDAADALAIALTHAVSFRIRDLA